jgi:hypothetical protein
MRGHLAVLLSGLMAVYPVMHALPARAVLPLQPQPAPLLNPIQLNDASQAQRSSLDNFQQQAIQDVLTLHALPSGDAVAAQTWGRDDSLAELWDLIVDAIQQPACVVHQIPGNQCRTVDQQNVVDWLGLVAQGEAVRAAQFAGLEYVKWAGLDANDYQNLLNQNPSSADLKTFLHQGFDAPANYAGQVSACPDDGTSCVPYGGNYYTEGFCVFQPPAPFQSDFSNRDNPTCFAPCTSSQGCTPFGPSYSDLKKWGAADANNQITNTSGFETSLTGVAVGIGFGIGTAAAVTGLALAAAAYVPTSILAFAVAPTVVPTMIFPFAAGVGVTVAGIAGIVLIAIVAAIVAGVYAADLFDAEAVPGELADFIAGASTTPLDLGAMLKDPDKLRGLFSLFVRATTPAPAMPCLGTSPVCLNPPAIPAASSQNDPQFSVQLNSGTADSPSLETATTVSSITWSDGGTATTARLTGNWFVKTATDADGNASTVQSLRLHYTDWNQAGHTAWLTRFEDQYKFVDVLDQGSDGTPLDPATCLNDGTCGYGPTINYVDPDGKLYQASVVPPPEPTVAAHRLTNPAVEGSPVQFQAAAVAPVGATITSYDWRFEDKSPNTFCASPPCMTNVATGQSLQYTFQTSGSFQGIVTITDSAGRTASDSFAVSVADVPPKLALTNGTVQTLGAATALGGTIAHAGSEDIERVDVTWGDGIHEHTSNDLLDDCPMDTCSPNLALNIGNTAFSATHTYAASGQYTVTVTVKDQSGATDVKTVTETVATPTATSVTANVNPSVVGQSVTYTATVTPAPNAGTVAFSDAGASIIGCTMQAVAANGTATCTVPATVGTHTIRAAYGGGGSYGASTSSPFTETVNQAATGTQLGSSPNPSVWGQSVTLTATVSVVSPGAGTPTGTVTFKDGAFTIGGCGSQAVDATGNATCVTSALSVGGHTIGAGYSGDSNFLGGKATTITQTVNKAATSITVGSSADPTSSGQSVTFTAMLGVTAPGAGTPTGTVTFKDGATTIGTGTVGANTATFSTAALATGSHTITASYGGDGNSLTSTSAALTQYVDTNLSGYPKLPSGAYNLSGRNLSGAYFAGASLVGANLSASNLGGTVFVGADLTGANLSNGNFFDNVNFTNAILKNANMANGNFKNANFSGANLTGANLTGSNLKGATGLKTAILTGVVWSGTTCPDGSISSNGGTCVGHLL